MRPIVLCTLVLTTAGAIAAQSPAARSAPVNSSGRSAAGRNPVALRAIQLLDLRKPGVAPRVRFEWEQVPGQPNYVLTGRWTDARSWELRSQEYSVTARTATRWDAVRVAFDVSLPEGTHSWQLVAVFGPDGSGDFARPAHVSFDIR